MWGPRSDRKGFGTVVHSGRSIVKLSFTDSHVHRDFCLFEIKIFSVLM